MWVVCMQPDHSGDQSAVLQSLADHMGLISGPSDRNCDIYWCLQASVRKKPRLLLRLRSRLSQHQRLRPLWCSGCCSSSSGFLAAKWSSWCWVARLLTRYHKVLQTLLLQRRDGHDVASMLHQELLPQLLACGTVSAECRAGGSSCCLLAGAAAGGAAASSIQSSLDCCLLGACSECAAGV